MEYIIYSVVLAGGFFVGYFVRKQSVSTKVKSAEDRAAKVLSEAKTKQTEILLNSQEKALKIIDEAKKEESKRHKEIKGMQSRLEQRENSFSQKLLDLQDKQQKMYDKLTQIESAKEKIKKIKGMQSRLEQRENSFSQKLLDLQDKQQKMYDKLTQIESAKEKIKKIRDEQFEKLEKIAAMTKDEARSVLFKNIEEQSKDDMLSRIKKLEGESYEVIDEKAKELITSSMQRLVSSYTSEVTTTAVEIPNDELKGRVIGREGRNIKVIERLTGTEIIVDDTPNVITVSGFSPIRRQIAKKALEKLVLDGRIHPTKIEEAIEAAKKDLALDIKKAGEEAMYELGITGFDPKLIQILGRLKYRTSYGQNGLGHSIEVAHLSGLIASELGLDVILAKKGGLLHDIGKAVDHEVQGTHPEIGRDIAKKFGLPQSIIDPIETHHDDKPRGIISVVVKVADAISAARPGARQDTFERYIQRLQELEKIATSFEGIEKAYAIQAGREVRIFVSPDNIDDMGAYNMARDVAKKIEEELKYPGEIKVNVIREMRAIEYAR